MAVIGAHVLLYSPEADRLRTTLRDVFGWEHVDAGQGWLIFALPPAELAIHPSETAGHQLSFMCDDLTTTVAELSAKGGDFEGDARNEDWGIATTMVLPGDVRVMLYEPRHATIV